MAEDSMMRTAVSRNDPRPPLEDKAELCKWIRRRYFTSPWDNQLVEKLEFVLENLDGQFSPRPKIFYDETMGVAITAPPRNGKSALVQHVLPKLIGEHPLRLQGDWITDSIAYCRLGPDATVKSVCQQICKQTGYKELPTRMTRHEAQELATYRLRLVGVKIVILDEIHNLLGKDEKSVSLFLKSLLQDRSGFCPIIIGTERLNQFIYRSEANQELAGRYLEFPLESFSQDVTIDLIERAIARLAEDTGLRPNASISCDPYFSDRILTGCRGSYGRCMRLISSTFAQAIEEGAESLDILDFQKVFDVFFKSFNSENPFLTSDWAARASIPIEEEERGKSSRAGKRKQRAAKSGAKNNG